MYLNSFFTCFFLLVWNGKAHRSPKPVAPSASWLENYIKSNVGSTSTEIWDGEGRWGGGPKTNKRNAKALRERQGKVVVHTYKSTHKHTHRDSDALWLEIISWKPLTGNWIKKASSAPCLFSLPPLFLSFLTASTIKCFPAEIIRFLMLFYILEGEKPTEKAFKYRGPFHLH